MPYATVNGVRLNYELHGESGEPLVFVHGYTGDMTDWRRQLPAFSQSFRVLIVDNRGHGQSEAPTDRSAYSIGHFADDIEALVDKLGIGRYHLLGHSMGGAVVQEIALRSADRLQSLILHDTTDDFSAATSNPAVAAWRDFRFKLASSEGMEAVANANSPFPPPPHMPAERLEETRVRMSKMSTDAFIGTWNGLEQWKGTRDRAAQIKAQTLVIYGDLDTEFLIKGSQRLAAAIPDAELSVIPEAAHQPQWERPQLYNAALGAFLNKVSGER